MLRWLLHFGAVGVAFWALHLYIGEINAGRSAGTLSKTLALRNERRDQQVNRTTRELGSNTSPGHNISSLSKGQQNSSIHVQSRGATPLTKAPQGVNGTQGYASNTSSAHIDIYLSRAPQNGSRLRTEFPNGGNITSNRTMRVIRQHEYAGNNLSNARMPAFSFYMQRLSEPMSIAGHRRRVEVPASNIQVSRSVAEAFVAAENGDGPAPAPAPDDAPKSDIISTLIGYLVWAVLFLAAYCWVKKSGILLTYRERFPKVAQLMLQMGLDKYGPFQAHICLHEITYGEADLKTVVVFKVREKQEESCQCVYGQSKRNTGTDVAIFEDVITIEIPQGVDQVKLELIDTDSRSCIAETKLTVEQIKSNKNEAEKTYQMKKTKAAREVLASDPKVTLSWTMEDGIGDGDKHQSVFLKDLPMDGMNRTMKLQMTKAAERAEKEKKIAKGQLKVPFRLLASTQLEMIASLGHGFLTSQAGFWSRGDKMYYSIYNKPDAEGRRTLNTWVFSWWETEKDCQKEKDMEGSIPILLILKVQAAKRTIDDFSITYQDVEQDTADTITLTCHDLNRDMWVEIVQLFINRLREVRKAIEQGLGDEGGGSRSASTRSKSKRPVSTKALARSMSDRDEPKRVPMSTDDSDAFSSATDHGGDVGGTSGERRPKSKVRSKSSRPRSTSKDREYSSDGGSERASKRSSKKKDEGAERSSKRSSK